MGQSPGMGGKAIKLFCQVEHIASCFRFHTCEEGQRRLRVRSAERSQPQGADAGGRQSLARRGLWEMSVCPL